jgi:3-oxoacyl-[acyl-carrier protein] reductase
VRDYLLDLSKNKLARDTIKNLGLPIPMPQPLERERGAWQEKPLEGRVVAVAHVGGAGLGTLVESTVAGLGAEAVATVPGDGRANALVIDATAVSTPASLRGLYDFTHPLLKQLKRCGRVVIIGRTIGGLGVSAAASQNALEGFMRSVGKELGRAGTTALLIRVEAGAEARLPGALRFALSPASAFVDLQPLEVNNRVAGTPPTVWAKQLDGKVAVVTGAARGIGAATARILAQEGAHVVVVDRPADEAPTKELATAISGTAFQLDVGSPDAGTRLAAFLKERFGGVDIVVHNAGITRDKTLARMSPEAWDQVIDINFASILRITEALLSGTLRDGGRIVCLSSTVGISGNVGQANYAASKAGVIGFVRALSTEVASRGITVNAVAPGFIETRMTAAVPFAIREAGRRMSALGQGGQPEDVGEAITFLASPGALGVTGGVLRVCGGSLLGA